MNHHWIFKKNNKEKATEHTPACKFLFSALLLSQPWMSLPTLCATWLWKVWPHQIMLQPQFERKTGDGPEQKGLGHAILSASLHLLQSAYGSRFSRSLPLWAGKLRHPPSAQSPTPPSGHANSIVLCYDVTQGFFSWRPFFSRTVLGNASCKVFSVPRAGYFLPGSCLSKLLLHHRPALACVPVFFGPREQAAFGLSGCSEESFPTLRQNLCR